MVLANLGLFSLNVGLTRAASLPSQAQAEAHGLERCESVGSEDAVTPSGRRRPGRLSWGDHAGEALEHVQTIERRKPRPGLLAHTMAVLKEELYWGFKRPGGEGDAPGAEEAALHDARANALANVAATRGAAPLAASCR